MKEVYLIILICTIHWIADFLLQTQKMATNKSSNFYWLWTHVAVYSSIWWIGIFFYPFLNVLMFVTITFFAHFITDYITSKLSKSQYSKKIYYGWNGFFTIIGLDQLLHHVQLILTFHLLTN